MKDLLLCVHVVVETLNLEISRCHLADYVKNVVLSACRTCSTIIFPKSTNQIILFYRRPCLSSLLSVAVGGNAIRILLMLVSIQATGRGD